MIEKWPSFYPVVCKRIHFHLNVLFLDFALPVVLNEPLRFGSFFCFSLQVKEST
jgi:hypothetical protein